MHREIKTNTLLLRKGSKKKDGGEMISGDMKRNNRKEGREGRVRLCFKRWPGEGTVPAPAEEVRKGLTERWNLDAWGRAFQSKTPDITTGKR